MIYARPLVQSGTIRPPDALELCGGAFWFDRVELLSRDEPTRIVDAHTLPQAYLDKLTAPRAAILGLDLTRPRLMGILNVTPDSFSDGGEHAELTSARDAARTMAANGADLIDIGGESTRPGAVFVPVDAEIARVAPVIATIREASAVPISIDTRKAPVARAAISAGANMINDVSGLTFDDDLVEVARTTGVPVCVMHAQGDPTTMQDDPQYDHVVLDVYDFLAERIAALVQKGISADQIIVDPGIGFGKSLDHNLALLRNIAVFHGLGVPILLGVSRKGFIGHLGQQADPRQRAPGSIAVGLAALGQGVQILRVHDVDETAQAIRLWQAVKN